MKLKIAPASQGIEWVKSGIRTFFKQPLALSGLLLMFFLFISLLSGLQWIGNVIALAFVPSIVLGLMNASKIAKEGNFPMPSILITAFQASPEQRKSMLILGIYYAVGFLLLFGLTALIDGGEFARFYFEGGTLTEKSIENNPQLVYAALLFFAGNIFLVFVFWFAPALVYWGNTSATQSVVFSVVACWRNKTALLVFNLAWAAVLFGCMILFNVLLAGLSAEFAMGFLGVLLLVFFSAFFASIWFTFEACFSS